MSLTHATTGNSEEKFTFEAVSIITLKSYLPHFPLSDTQLSITRHAKGKERQRLKRQSISDQTHIVQNLQYHADKKF